MDTNARRARGTVGDERNEWYWRIVEEAIVPRFYGVITIGVEAGLIEAVKVERHFRRRAVPAEPPNAGDLNQRCLREVGDFVKPGFFGAIELHLQNGVVHHYAVRQTHLLKP